MTNIKNISPVDNQLSLEEKGQLTQKVSNQIKPQKSKETIIGVLGTLAVFCLLGIYFIATAENQDEVLNRLQISYEQSVKTEELNKTSMDAAIAAYNAAHSSRIKTQCALRAYKVMQDQPVQDTSLNCDFQ
jgi:hypothetical protein